MQKTKNKIRSTFSFILKTGLLNFTRHHYLNLATILVIALILFIFNVILSINFITQSVLDTLHQKVDIIIYLKDSANITEINQLKEELTNFPEIKNIKYTSKEKALETLLQTYPDTENPFHKYGLENKLPANIQIITENPQDHPKIFSYLQESQFNHLLSGLENNQESQQIAQELTQISQFTQKIIIAVMAAFIIGGLLIILNSVNLSLYTRRKELRIMRLAGATPGFLQAPFILEGALYGLLSVLASLLLLFLFLYNLDLINIYFNPTNLNLILLEILIGILIGICSSLLALSRQLKKKFI